MRKISFLALASLIVACVSFQTASAQFPVRIKIPKPSQPKPQPTPADTTQATTDSMRPAQPRPDDRSTAKPAPRADGGEK